MPRLRQHHRLPRHRGLGKPGDFTCLRCERRIVLDDPVVATGLLKEAVLASIRQQSHYDAEAVWVAPRPTRAAAIRPKAAEAAAAFAVGRWILTAADVPFLRELLGRLTPAGSGTTLGLHHRVRLVQDAVVALCEQRGSEWEVRAWLADCSRTLAPVAHFTADGFREHATGTPYGLIDAEEALTLIRDVLRGALDAVARF